MDNRTLPQPKDEFSCELAELILSYVDRQGERTLPLKKIQEAVERGVLIKSLNRHNGNQRLAAFFLCLKPTTLCAKLKKHNVRIQRHIIDASYPPKETILLESPRL